MDVPEIKIIGFEQEKNSRCNACLTWTRSKVTRLPLYRVVIGLFFTFIHDAAGLFSASDSLGYVLKFSEVRWVNVLIISCFMIILDCGSEIMLVLVHDVPLCKGRIPDRVLVRVALAGQILTSLSWASIFAMVLYRSIFFECLNTPDFFDCDALPSGVISSLVVLMVFIKNSTTLKDYYDRAFVFPIICNESLLYLYHFMNNEKEKIIRDFEAFHELDENWEPSCTTDPTYNVIIQVIVVLLMDVAAIASVSSLISTPGSTPFHMFVKSVPFIIIIVVDIVSELIILFYHDIPICNQEEEEIYENIGLFSCARVMQVLVFVAWLVTFIYIAYVVSHLDCQDLCQCNVVVTDVSCSSPSCPYSKTCNDTCSSTEQGVCTTLPISVKPHQNYTMNCTITQTSKTCILSYPTSTNCILLGLVIVEAFYQLVGMYFKSFIYPITIPEEVMFLVYWMNNDKDKLILKVGKNEFGLEWEFENLDNILSLSKDLILSDSLY